MLKGMLRADATTFKVRASFQGEIEGKRVGTTQNLGPRARARAPQAPQNSDATSVGNRTRLS